MAGDITFKPLLQLDLPGVLVSSVPDLAVVLGLPAEAHLLSAEALLIQSDRLRTPGGEAAPVHRLVGCILFLRTIIH